MLTSKKWLGLFALMLGVALAISSCQPEPEVVTKEVEKVITRIVEGTPQVETVVETQVVEVEKVVTPTPEPEDPVIEELVVGQVGNPVSLTCWDNTALDEVDILNHFVEPLFQFNRDGTLEGRVAESWEMVSPTEWVIQIRQGLQFHDPEYGELKAEDVVASLDACFRDGGRSAPKMAGPILDREVEIVDDYTIRVTMPEPGTAALPNYWVIAYISDKDYLETVGDDFSRRPMGTGPFKFVDWIPNVRIEGERFENYWDDRPAVERITWRIIPDDFTRKSEFVTGELDILPFMQPQWVPEITDNADLRVETVLSSRFVMIVFPAREPPYDDQRVRQALNYAVNKQEIVDQLFQGIGAEPLRGATNPILPEADPDRVGYPYDPDKAKELLEEARADGVQIDEITLYAPNDRYTLDKEMGEAVAGYWRDLGLEVEYIPQSRSVLFPKVQAFEMTDPYMFGHGNNMLRADYTYHLWLAKRPEDPSRGYIYTNGPDEWDEIIDEIANLVSGTPESIEMARKLDEMVTEYAPWLFLVNYVDLYGVSNDVEWTPFPTEMRLYKDARPAN